MKFKKEADNLYCKLEQKELGGKIVCYKPRRVYPILNPDGSINWFNLLTGGTYWKLAIAIFIVLVALGFIWEYHANLEQCAKVMSDYNLNCAKVNLTNQPSLSMTQPNLTWNQ